jgi:hypothetical protein
VFVLTGPIAWLDLAARRLLVGSHLVEVILPIRLDQFRLGDHVLINGVRDSSSGREIAIEIVRPPLSHPATPSRAADGRARPANILSLVVSLLLELHQEAQLLECELLPTNDQYAIRVQIPGEVGKAVLIPRSVLDRALGEPEVRRRARNLLRAAIETLRSQRALSDAREVMAAARGPRDTRCLRCAGPLTDELVVVVEGGRVHLTCPPDPARSPESAPAPSP